MFYNYDFKKNFSLLVQYIVLNKLCLLNIFRLLKVNFNLQTKTFEENTGYFLLLLSLEVYWSVS